MNVKHNFHPTYRPDIDGLRAIAVLFVVAYHAFPSRFTGGFAGVDIFFVISGFLISSIILNSLQRGTFSFIEFYIHRINRIFPALACMLAAVFVLGWLLMLPEDYKQLGKHMAAGVGFVQNFVLFDEVGYFDSISELKPLLHLWSLAIEEQFYVIYPLLIWIVWRLRLTVPAVLALLAAASFTANIWWVRQNPDAAFFLPFPRFWELLTGGMLVYLGVLKGDGFSFRIPGSVRKLLRNISSVTGLLLCILTMIFLGRESIFPGWVALLPVLGAALAILGGPDTWVNRYILGSRPLVFIGLISYPLYLWHWPLLSFVRIAGPEMLLLELRIVAVAISFVLAWLTWKYIEGPIRAGRKTVFKPVALSICCAALGAAGLYVYRGDGLPQRLQDQTLTSAQFPWRNMQNELCLTRFPQLKTLDYCLLSSNAAPEVILLGDSHANQLYPGMAKQFVTLNIGNSGCPPFLDVERQDNPNLPPTCQAKTNREAIDFLFANNKAQYVVITARYNSYLSGHGFGERERREQDNPIRIVSREGGSNEKVFVRGLRRTLERLTSGGKKVILLLDVPELGFPPKACIGLNLGLAPPRNPCALPRTEFEARDARFRKLIKMIALDYPAIFVFDPTDTFCDSHNCWAVKGGEFMYRDDNHLSVEGSRYLAEHLANFMRSLPGQVASEKLGKGGE